MKTASELWDLLHEVAPFVPIANVELHRKVQQALDEGVEQNKGSTQRFPVYSDDRSFFFSDYSKREFGVNCDVVLHDGTVVFNSVQPANEYVKSTLPIVGYIEV